MARVAATAALLRSVPSSSRLGVARAPPPLHRKEGLSSAAPLNKLGRHSVAWAAINAAPFLAFGVVMCGLVKPELEEFRESFAAASRERLEMKEGIIQSIKDEFQKIRELLEHHREFTEGGI